MKITKETKLDDIPTGMLKGITNKGLEVEGLRATLYAYVQRGYYGTYSPAGSLQRINLIS